MNGWALTTAVIKGTPYDTDISPLTFPLMEEYADRWDMDFLPFELYNGGEWHGEVSGHSPAPLGTEADYASVLHRRMLLDDYEGVVFLDSDLVIVDPTEDICTTVDAAQPIGSVNGWGCVVMKSGELSKAFLDTVWAMRDHYRTYQWLEQAAAAELIGWDGVYRGTTQPAQWIGPTPWTRYCREIDPKWNYGPHAPQPCPDPHFMHPYGVQPYPLRLQMIQGYVDLARQLHNPE